MRAFVPRSVSEPEPITTPDWLAGCLAGEAAAITAMFKEYLSTVEGILFRLLGPTPDLPDLTQSVFASAIQSMSRFRGESSFKTWISKIAVYTAHHHLRAGRVRRMVPLASIPPEQLGVDARDLERELDERHLALKLHALLDKISAKNRIALLLFGVEGLSAAEVAKLMGATEVATRSRVFLARRELRALINADEELRSAAESLLGRRCGRDS